jgi:hypothetical protein
VAEQQETQRHHNCSMFSVENHFYVCACAGNPASLDDVDKKKTSHGNVVSISSSLSSNNFCRSLSSSASLLWHFFFFFLL